MLVFTVLLTTLLIYYVKSDNSCILKEPVYPNYSKFDFNMSKMITVMAPYNVDEECEPIRLWMCVRPGVKHPSQDILDDIFVHINSLKKSLIEVYKDKNHNNYTKLKKNVQFLIDSLIEWNNVTEDGLYKGNERSEKTMEILAKKINAKFQKLTTKINSSEIEVLTAENERYFNSAKIFLMEFLPKDTFIKINITRNTMADNRLKLHKLIDGKIKVPDITEPNKNKKINVEHLYYKMKHPEIKARVGKLLYPDHIEDYEEKRKILTLDMIRTMYYACAHGYYFEKNENKTDAWCHVFSYEDLKIIEDMHDLKYYNENGYYDSDTPKLGNAIVEDMLLFLKKPNGKKLKYFSGNKSNILSIITRLNLFKDKEKLTVKNIHKMTIRKWRTSNISPFASNIMVAVYDCNREDLQVAIYINEKPIEIELRNAYGTFNCVKCPLNEIVKILLTLNLRDKYMTLPLSVKEIQIQKEKAEKFQKNVDKEVLQNKKIYEEYLKKREQNVLPTSKL